MKINAEIVLLLICSQIFLFLLHIITLRVFRRKNVGFLPLLLAVKCALLGNIPLLAALWFLLVPANKDTCEIVNAILYSLIVYNALAYSYCHLFNMSETARRIRILYELKLSGGSSKYQDIASKYGARDMLEIRIERLKAIGQISEVQGHFVLKSSLLYWIALAVMNWGFLLGYNLGLRQDLKRRKGLPLPPAGII